METLFYFFVVIINIISSLLFFWIQPLIAKIILPIFGGVASVWTTCVLFFQVLLFLGYSYVHFIFKYSKGKKILFIHILLLLTTLLFIPISNNKFSWIFVQLAPAVNILATLGIVLALPVFILSQTSPLTQNLLYKYNKKRFSNPYHLYVASNFGSTLGLLGFVFLFEPLISIRYQVLLWNIIYYVFITLAMLVSIIFILKFQSKRQKKVIHRYVNKIDKGTNKKVEYENIIVEHKNIADEHEEIILNKNQQKMLSGDLQILSSRNSRSEYTGSILKNYKSNIQNITLLSSFISKYIKKEIIIWFFYSFIPIGILLSITEYVSTEIASLPLLWVIPLFLYLLSFQIAFLNNRFILEKKFKVLLSVLIIVTLCTMRIKNIYVIFIHFSNFFVLSLYFHKKLYNCKPQAKDLTKFYFIISISGIIAGIFNVFVYPKIFSTYLEYSLFCLIILLFVTQFFKRKWKIVTYIMLLFIIVLDESGLYNKFMQRETLFQSRNFYGVNKIVKSSLDNTNILYNNGIVQGAQQIIVNAKLFENDDNLGLSNTLNNKYFTDNGLNNNIEDNKINKVNFEIKSGTYFNHIQPIIQFKQNKKSSLDVAIAGLGTGTMACFARSEDNFSFYELNPLIKKIAQNPKFFTYLKECPAKGGVHLGDARINIALSDDNSFDIIIIDVYNTSSIPIHLLTYEAFEIYKRKLKDDGIILMHISNGYFNLLPILAVGANALDMELLYTASEKFNLNNKLELPSKWVIIANSGQINIKDILSLNLTKCTLLDFSKYELWTDNYANIYQALF